MSAKFQVCMLKLSQYYYSLTGQQELNYIGYHIFAKQLFDRSIKWLTMDSPTAGLFWDLDKQNSTNASCHQFTSEQWNALIIARTVTASLSCLACFIAFIMMIVFKAYKQFVHRLILYLTLAAFCLSILYALQILPTKEVGDTILLRVGWRGLCTAIAFLDQYTGWVMLLILCWISLYIFLLAVFRCSTAKHKYELFGLLFIVVHVTTHVHLDTFPLGKVWSCWCMVLD